MFDCVHRSFSLSGRAQLAAMFVASSLLLPAGDLSSYCGLRFGATGSVSASHAGYKPGYTVRHDAADADSVRNIVLRFYNGALFQIVSAYDWKKVDGLQSADLIEMTSSSYRTASTPGGEIPYRDTAAVIAQWEDSDYSADLIRSPEDVSFALLLTSKRLDALARVAVHEARRLDDDEAPRRATEQLKARETAERLLREQVRSTNKHNFRP